jgi:hypothetical protein
MNQVKSMFFNMLDSCNDTRNQALTLRIRIRFRIKHAHLINLLPIPAAILFYFDERFSFQNLILSPLIKQKSCFMIYWIQSRYKRSCFNSPNPLQILSQTCPLSHFSSKTSSPALPFLFKT